MTSNESLWPLIAGFTGGTVSTTLLLPIDVVKVRLQVHESQRLGFVRALRGIIKYEGVYGLWSGWTPAVIGSAISWGGYFYFYEGLKKMMVQYKTQSTEPTTASSVLNSGDNFLLACTAGGMMVFITNPIWLIKLRMQLQMKRASLQHNLQPYRNVLDAVRTIVRQEGPLALYKGVGPALLLTSHGGVQFVVYEYLRKHFHYQKAQRDKSRTVNEDDVWHRLEKSTGYLTIGAIAKITASTVTYPLQVMKARMQQRASQALEFTADGRLEAINRTEYTSMMMTARRMWQAEGLTGFFKGCIPNAVRVAPSAAITFVVYESVMEYCENNFG